MDVKKDHTHAIANHPTHMMTSLTLTTLDLEEPNILHLVASWSRLRPSNCGHVPPKSRPTPILLLLASNYLRTPVLRSPRPEQKPNKPSQTHLEFEPSLPLGKSIPTWRRCSCSHDEFSSTIGTRRLRKKTTKELKIDA